MEALRKIYKDDLEETIVSFINAEATKLTAVCWTS